MRIMLRGGLHRVNRIWRSRRDVPKLLREYLPAPYNMSGKNGGPIGTLTKSTKTGNKPEAMRIARRENHQGMFDRILAQAAEHRKAALKEARINWQGEAVWNDRMQTPARIPLR